MSVHQKINGFAKVTPDHISSSEEKALAVLRTLQYILVESVAEVMYEAVDDRANVWVRLYNGTVVNVEIRQRATTRGLIDLPKSLGEKIAKHINIALYGYPLIPMEEARQLRYDFDFLHEGELPANAIEDPYGWPKSLPDRSRRSQKRFPKF